MTHILSLFVALALMLNGVPAVAVLSAAAGPEQTTLSASTGEMADDMEMGDCCNTCTPTTTKDRACFATCVHLPALPAGVLTSAILNAPVFEAVPLAVIHGRPIPPDPLPPRRVI
jgi:hypothetical protein